MGCQSSKESLTQSQMRRKKIMRMSFDEKFDFLMKEKKEQNKKNNDTKHLSGKNPKDIHQLRKMST